MSDKQPADKMYRAVAKYVNNNTLHGKGPCTVIVRLAVNSLGEIAEENRYEVLQMKDSGRWEVQALLTAYPAHGSGKMRAWAYAEPTGLSEVTDIDAFQGTLDLLEDLPR